MEDLISRQTIIDGLEFVIEHGIETDGAHSISAEKMLEFVRELPTVQPEPHWIPVTQVLPEDDTVVLVCGKSGGIYTAIHNNSKTWIRGWWKMNSKNHHCNPTAWMPLPEPYKGVTT